MVKEEMENHYRREDNEMLVRRFVGNVGYDYVQHHKKNTAKIHPDFSEETCILWKEIEKRLQNPVTIDFDREKCISILKEKAEEQAEMCSKADYASSYHYGLKQAYWEAIRIIKDCLTKAEESKTEI